MNIKIVAINDGEVYAGLNIDDGDYYIISLNESKIIEINDILSGDFDSSKPFKRNIYNETRNYNVNIYLESWHCSLNATVDLLLHLGSPTRVFTAAKDFPTKSDDVVNNLRKAIATA
jgi:hypothetical protein